MGAVNCPCRTLQKRPILSSKRLLHFIVSYIIRFRLSDLVDISLIRMAQNKKLRFRIANIPTMDIVRTKENENIMLSSYRHQHNS